MFIFVVVVLMGLFGFRSVVELFGVIFECFICVVFLEFGLRFIIRFFFYDCSFIGYFLFIVFLDKVGEVFEELFCVLFLRK